MKTIKHKCPYCGQINEVYINESDGMYECSGCLRDVDTKRRFGEMWELPVLNFEQVAQRYREGTL